MLKTFLKIFKDLVAFLISAIPAGPNIPDAAGDLIRGGVGFFKTLHWLIPVTTEGIVIVIMLTYIVAKIAFRGLVFVYRNIRGGGG